MFLLLNNYDFKKLEQTKLIMDRNNGISGVPFKSQAHPGTSLFTSAATNQNGCPKGSPL